MKKNLLLIVFIGLFLQLNAQEVACVPDPNFIEADIVSPLPLDLNTMEGGIADFPACIGEPFELVFTFRAGDSITTGGFMLDLIKAEIETTGGIAGLPEGINYFCNPPDCIFADTVAGCIVLKGTPTANNAPGVKKLVISAAITLDIIGEINETIPGMVVPGEYNLVLNEAGTCTVGTNDYLAQKITLGNSPNPVADQTTIEITSLLSGDFKFHVFDITGKTLHTQKVQLNVGYNTFNYNAADLESGMYFYTISDGTAAVASKLIVE